jgi:branched-chain amino acid transport system substrate-binding protein
MTALSVAASTQISMALQGAKAMGQSVESVTLDENTVAITQTNMKKLIEEHKMVAVLGGTDAASALAMNGMAGDVKIPLVVHCAMFDGLTGKNCTPWTFRVPIPFSIQFPALNPHLVGYGKKWFLLGVESVPGTAILELARHEMQGVGATEVGADTVLPGDKAATGCSPSVIRRVPRPCGIANPIIK